MTVSGLMAILVNFPQFSPDFFVAVYMMLFGALLFSYEVMTLKAVDFIIGPLRKNFGFLFGIKGKSIFIIFVAFLNFGLNSAAEPAKSLGLATGISFLVSGVLHFGIMLKYPEYLTSAVPAGTTYNPQRR